MQIEDLKNAIVAAFKDRELKRPVAVIGESHSEYKSVAEFCDLDWGRPTNTHFEIAARALPLLNVNSITYLWGAFMLHVAENERSMRGNEFTNIVFVTLAGDPTRADAKPLFEMLRALDSEEGAISTLWLDHIAGTELAFSVPRFFEAKKAVLSVLEDF